MAPAVMKNGKTRTRPCEERAPREARGSSQAGAGAGPRRAGSPHRGTVLLAALAAMLALLAAAPGSMAGEAIYRSEDEQGRPVFSDQPPSDDAEPIELEPLGTFSLPPAPRAAARPSAEEEGPDDRPYDELAIASPGEDEAVRSNVGDVTVTTRLSPGLHSGHRLELLLDGELRAVDETGSGTFSLSNVHRGTHSLEARVVDEEDEVLISSEPVQFHMLQISVLTRPDS